MKKFEKLNLILWPILLLGLVKLYYFESRDASQEKSVRLLGDYCAELGELNLRLKADATGRKEFSLQGRAGKLVAPINERLIQNALYLQAPPLNYSESFDNYYSKIRPLAFEENGVVRAFRYHDMIYDQRDCGEIDG